MNKLPSALQVIGAAMGVGAKDQGCSQGPIVLRNSPFLQPLNSNLNWQSLLYAQNPDLTGLAAIPTIVDLCERLAAQTYSAVHQQQPFAVVGGDHSCAIGTWSGVATALQNRGALGLLWIDAHMDSHTPQTTPSNNVHGMPLACLLGQGDPALTEILSPRVKLHPENVCLIGIRSFEAGEAELLKRLKVRVYFMDEIRERGLSAVFQEALSIVQRNTVGYGLSIDLDVLDPSEAPAVGTPEPAGIRVTEFYQALDFILQDPGLLGMEIAEFNPNHDQQQKTEKIIAEIFRMFIHYTNRQLAKRGNHHELHRN